MSYHLFAILTEQGESGVKTAEFEALFAPDAKLYSPFLVKSVEGKKLTMHFLTEAFKHVGYPKYTHQFTDGDKTIVLLWNSQGQVQGFDVQGTMVLTFNDDGLIIGAKSYLRPLQVVALLREFLIPTAAAKLSQDYWDAAPEGFAGDPSLLQKNATADMAPKSSS